jgi:hypothetical protein
MGLAIHEITLVILIEIIGIQNHVLFKHSIMVILKL